MPETNDTDKELAVELAELLTLLPPVNNQDEREWWVQFAAARREHRDPRRPAPPDGADYMLRKLRSYLANPTLNPYYFAGYCLRCFDDPSPKMAEMVGHQLDLSGSGARVLKAICDLAWKIYLPSKIADRQSFREVELQILPGRPILPPGSEQL